MPMDSREDALVKAAERILRIREIARGIDGAVATVGRVEVEPGAATVIPERVTLRVEARAPDVERCDVLVGARGLVPFYRTDPAEMAPELRAVLRDELERRE